MGDIKQSIFMKGNQKNFNKEKGKYTIAGLIITFIIIAVIVAIIIGMLDKPKYPRPEPPPPPPPPLYKCMTSKSGLVPIKVTISNQSDANLYSSPNIDSISGTKLQFFKIFFVFDKKNGFYEIGTNPLIKETDGWVSNSDVFEWTTREALKFKQVYSESPVLIWKNESEIGSDNWLYKQRTDIETKMVFPILAAKGDHFKIVLAWQTESWDESGVDIGWTSGIETPTQAEIVCYISRKELMNHMKQLYNSIKEMRDKPYDIHPVIQLFKEDLGITFGNGLVLEEESIGFIKRIANEAPKVPDVFKKQPREVLNEYQHLNTKLQNMRRFYEDESNWNNQGGAWIPLSLIPGN